MVADEYPDGFGARLLDNAFVVFAYLTLLAAVALAVFVLLPRLDQGTAAWNVVAGASVLAVGFVAYRVVQRLELVGSLLDRWT